MRIVIASLCVTAGLASAPGPAAGTPLDRGIRAAEKWAKARHGTVSFAVRTPGRLRGHRTWRAVPSVSLAKTMMLVAYLRRPAVRRRPLRGWERRMLAPMIRRSDNAAAARTLGITGWPAMSAVARAARMRDFRADTYVWGQSITSARDQAELFWRLRRLLPNRHERWAMRQLATIVRGQRWGIGRVSLPGGWRLYFKGGWGSGRGLVDHQAALLERGRRRLALAITTQGNGSQAEGNRTLEGVARRLLRHLRP